MQIERAISPKIFAKQSNNEYTTNTYSWKRDNYATVYYKNINLWATNCGSSSKRSARLTTMSLTINRKFNEIKTLDTLLLTIYYTL